LTKLKSPISDQALFFLDPGNRELPFIDGGHSTTEPVITVNSGAVAECAITVEKKSTNSAGERLYTNKSPFESASPVADFAPAECPGNATTAINAHIPVSS